MARVLIESLSKTFPGGSHALRNIDLDISDGELVVVVGPSGCGKSTLMRLVAGLEAVTTGTIRIGDRVVNALEPSQRNVAMVFQNYALYPHMTVFDNMAYGLRNRGFPRAEIERRVRETAETLQLADLLDRKPRQLSGGQRQRVAMGRAIVREPAVFLFDEPLSNLDAKLRVLMRIEIKRLQRAMGTTSIYVTHDQVEAMTLADRLVVMREGIAEQIGAPLDIYAQPATVFVASFIGSPAMNFIGGRFGASAQWLAFDGGGGMALTPTALSELGDRPVFVGIRPEHIEVCRDGGTAAFSVAVDLVEPLGADTLVHAHLGDDEQTITFRLSATEHRPKPGDVVPLSVRADSLHFFDTATGHALR
jgi:sn-glycerol 3-phosphate transport system ATP-binding protein